MCVQGSPRTSQWTGRHNLKARAAALVIIMSLFASLPTGGRAKGTAAALWPLTLVVHPPSAASICHLGAKASSDTQGVLDSCGAAVNTCWVLDNSLVVGDVQGADSVGVHRAGCAVGGGCA